MSEAGNKRVERVQVSDAVTNHSHNTQAFYDQSEKRHHTIQSLDFYAILCDLKLFTDLKPNHSGKSGLSHYLFLPINFI